MIVKPALRVIATIFESYWLLTKTHLLPSIISLLVTFFTNLSHLKQEEKEIDQVAQTTDFNKQFDVYFRNIYGSELFSLVNKIEDYNKREGDLKDYTKVIDNYASKIYAREKKYQTEIINLQKALQYSISESDRKQKHYQTTISNLQNTIGISIDNAAKQEYIYKSRIKKIKTIAIIACLFCIVVGYYLANII